MAVIAIADCTVTVLGCEATARKIKIVTPTTADDGDTIDCSTYFTNHLYGFCYGATDGCLSLNNTPTSTTVIIPGATDNEARTIIAMGD